MSSRRVAKKQRVTSLNMLCLLGLLLRGGPSHVGYPKRNPDSENSPSESFLSPRTLARRAEDSGAVGIVIIDNEARCVFAVLGFRDVFFEKGPS